MWGNPWSDAGGGLFCGASLLKENRGEGGSPWGDPFVCGGVAGASFGLGGNISILRGARGGYFWPGGAPLFKENEQFCPPHLPIVVQCQDGG